MGGLQYQSMAEGPLKQLSLGLGRDELHGEVPLSLKPEGETSVIPGDLQAGDRGVPSSVQPVGQSENPPQPGDQEPVPLGQALVLGALDPGE